LFCLRVKVFLFLQRKCCDKEWVGIIGNIKKDYRDGLIGMAAWHPARPPRGMEFLGGCQMGGDASDYRMAMNIRDFGLPCSSVGNGSILSLGPGAIDWSRLCHLKQLVSSGSPGASPVAIQEDSRCFRK
jgi:hypothetical protein